jgi:hypothetical protein
MHEYVFLFEQYRQIHFHDHSAGVQSFNSSISFQFKYIEEFLASTTYWKKCLSKPQ